MEAVKEVTEGETPVAAAVPEIAVPLLGTALSVDETAALSVEVGATLSVPVDTAELSIAVAEVKSVLLAVAATVVLAGAMMVPGVAVIAASLLTAVLDTSLSVAVAETLLVASDRVAEVVAELSLVRSVAMVLAVESEVTLSEVADVIAALSVAEAFALSVTEAVVDKVEVLEPVTVLSVPVADGRELESVIDPGMAPVVLSAALVGVAEASVIVAEVVSDASEAEALDKRLEKSEANEAEMALSVAVATTLESSESRDEAMLDKAPLTIPVAVGTGGLGIIKSVEQIEEIELELTFNFIVVQETPGQALATMEELEELDWFLSRLDRVA